MANNGNENGDASKPRAASPAVASLHEEQARQRSGKGKLQEGLEETFPASDPVSHTITTTARSPEAPEDNDGDAAAPKVDEALAAVKARTDASHSGDQMDEIRAMRSELGRISESAQELLSASGRVTRGEAHSVRRIIVREIRKYPLQSLGLAALVGYVWGMTR